MFEHILFLIVIFIYTIAVWVCFIGLFLLFRLIASYLLKYSTWTSIWNTTNFHKKFSMLIFLILLVSIVWYYMLFENKLGITIANLFNNVRSIYMIVFLDIIVIFLLILSSVYFYKYSTDNKLTIIFDLILIVFTTFIVSFPVFWFQFVLSNRGF